jgi:signal transduction histidine kinase
MWSSIESFFLPKNLTRDAKKHRLATLQIKFNVVSILFGIGYWVNTYATGFVVARILMVISSLLFLFQLFAFKWGTSLRLISHSFVFLCWTIVVVLCLFSGGIKSYVIAWFSLIPIMGLLLLSHRASLVWAGLGVIAILGFHIFNPEAVVAPALITETNDLLITSLNIGLLLLIFTLSYIFYQQQGDLFDKLEQQNVDLIRNQGEIAAQNEELVQSREELASQRDKVAEQNHKIEEARKVIEAQHQILFEKNEDLENQIAKRPKELVEYNQQLEQFAFMSSHNLRAPIASILGLGNLLELTNEKSDETKIQQNLIAAARELDRVVKDLNTILEIRKNNISSVQEIDLAEEFDLIRLNLEKEITETNTTLTVDFSGATSIRTVRPYLDSILINLVSNAIKYRHPDRKPIVEVKSGFRGDLFFLEVKDNGVGIDLDTYGQKIFTLYSRFHNHVEGKGLGLYLVKTQCEALGGNVTVTSNLQIGTTFTASFKPSTQ